MTEAPFFLDIILLLILLPALEVLILWRNYRVFSPITIFCAGMIALYIMPYTIHFYVSPDWRLMKLGMEQFGLAINTLRLFLYPFTIVSILGMLSLKNLQSVVITPQPYLLKKRFLQAIVFYCLILIIYLGVGVGFSPAAMIDRALHPRAYTYIKLSLGPLTHLYNGMRFVLTMTASMWLYEKRKSTGAWIIFVICALLSVLGSTKSGLVLPFIVLVVVWQQCSWKKGNPIKKLWQTMLASFAGIFLVVAGFAFITTGESRELSYALREIPSYHKEAYYLPLVIEHFPWKAEYPIRTISDVFISPIPRAIWKSKPPDVGLWARYFRSEFEPKTVYYHTSTFGCIAESHMLFGMLGPSIYGLFWGFLVYKLYSIMINSSSIFKSYLVSVMVFWTYLLLRTGFVGVNLWIMCFYAFVGWIFLRRLESQPECNDSIEESIYRFY